VYNCICFQFTRYTIVHYTYCTLHLLEDQPEDDIVIRPKHVAEYNLIQSNKHKVVYYIIYIYLYYNFSIQHNGDVSLKKEMEEGTVPIDSHGP